ncbi:MAG: hypothetical protein ACKO0M_12645, partial [Cyanobium sp.]
MTTSPSATTPSRSSSNGESFASLPQWRQFLSMLNWRRDPDYERRISALRSDSERIRRETEQIRRECEQIEKDTEQIERDTEQIEKETELLRQENARLRMLNARTKALISCVDQHC